MCNMLNDMAFELFLFCCKPQPDSKKFKASTATVIPRDFFINIFNPFFNVGQSIRRGDNKKVSF